MSGLASNLDVHVHPPPVAQGNTRPGASHQNPEIGLGLQRGENRVRAAVTAPSLVVDGEVQPSGKLYIQLGQQLQHRQHNCLVGFVLPHPLPVDAGFVEAPLGGPANLAGKGIIHLFMALGRSVDHDQQRLARISRAQPGYQLVLRHVGNIVDTQRL